MEPCLEDVYTQSLPWQAADLHGRSHSTDATGLPQLQALALPTRMEMLPCSSEGATCHGTLGFLLHQRLPDQHCHYFVHTQHVNTPCHPYLLTVSPPTGG